MKVSRRDLKQTLDEVEQDFVGLWRQMSSLWGVSPTMAEIPGCFISRGRTCLWTTSWPG